MTEMEERTSGAKRVAEPLPSEQDLEARVVAQEAPRMTGRFPAGHEAAWRRPYQLCSVTVMDTTDPTIRFDERGRSSWATEFSAARALETVAPEHRETALRAAVDMIRTAGRDKPYDCILGLSGGCDSSYLCLAAVRLGLRPLVVHFDNGWNSELAIANIQSIVQTLGLDLHTFVMDWPEFRDLQRSYFQASVLDLEVPTDHMIFGALYKTAAQHGIRHVLSGNNFNTEWLLPKSWNYAKFDLANLRGIHRKYGTVPLRKLPALGLSEQIWYQQVRRMDVVRLLDLMDYDKRVAKREIIAELGWRDYGGKHHESVFTRFYQGYILPTKFNIDKRKAHVSNLVLSGQATRREALAEILEPPYPQDLQREDFTYVAKKLGWSDDELREILARPNRSHSEFASDAAQRALYMRMLRRGQPLKRLVPRWVARRLR